MLPRLPSAAEILPYISRIDAARHYTNSGPLLEEFEARLAANFGVEPAHVACVANATLGLVLCLLALTPAGEGRCITPAWTFEATAVAARAAGLEPWFHDVDEQTWALRAADVRRTLVGCEEPVAAIIAVSPFGAGVDISEWDRFTAEAGIPVVIDAAGGFDTLRPGSTPSVVSLHATKLLSTGEGGAVISRNADLVAHVRHLANFGFEPLRRIVRSGLNAKMSEYAAAVGLAGLDGWRERRRLVAERAADYRRLLGDRNDLSFAPGFGDGAVQPTCNLRLADGKASALVDVLACRGVEARKWWGDGCHRQPAFAGCPRGRLAITEALAKSVIGLPFFADISRSQIERVAAALDRRPKGAG